MFHQILVPKRPVYHGICVDPEAAKADKRLRYFQSYFIFSRYKLSYRDFSAKVEDGTWNPYLAK